MITSAPRGILNTIKKMLGLMEDYSAFDKDLIVLINSAVLVLKQIGVAKDEFPGVTGPEETWEQMLTDVNEFADAKTYIYLKVRKTFDPPTSQTVMAAMNETISESEWRLNAQAETEALKP